jgi:hypothetical protein
LGAAGDSRALGIVGNEGQLDIRIEDSTGLVHPQSLL